MLHAEDLQPACSCDFPLLLRACPWFAPELWNLMLARLVERLELQLLVKRIREGRMTWIMIQPAGLELIPEIHDAWHELYRLYNKELGQSKAEKINRKIANIINGENND